MKQANTPNKKVFIGSDKVCDRRKLDAKKVADYFTLNKYEVVTNPKKADIMNGYKKSYRKYYNLEAIAERFYFLVRSHPTFANLIMFFAENLFTRAYSLHHVGRE